MRISDWSSDVCSSDLNQTTRKIVMCVAAALSYALPLEHFCHVLADAGLHVAKRRGIARLAQLGRIGLGVALVTPLQVFREGNVADRIPLYQIGQGQRSEEHTAELQSLMRISYAGFCLKQKNKYTSKQDRQ